MCVEVFLPHSDEKFHRRTRQYFINFGYRKSLDERVGGAGCQKFPSKTSCLTVPEKFVRQAFRVSLHSGIEKFYASEGYVTIFCRNFLSHSAEKFCRGTLLCCVSESFLYRISLWTRSGEYQKFLSGIFCLTLPKKFVSEPLSVSLIWGIEKVYASGGYVTNIRRTFFVQENRKTLKGNPSVLFQKISGSEKVFG